MLKGQCEVVVHLICTECHLRDQDPFTGETKVQFDKHSGSVVKVNSHVSGTLQYQIWSQFDFNRSCRPNIAVIAKPRFGTSENLN